MGNSPKEKIFELICIIVNFGLGSKVIKIAKQNGISGATIFLGKGTIKNRILEFLALSDIRKEIVLMVSEKTTAYNALEKINRQFNFNKPDRGIAFTTPVMALLGSRSYKYIDMEESGGGENKMYNAIFVVVDKGKSETVIETATKAGSKGGTIINARGSGIHETKTLFSMPIEPEKEVVMILSENKLTDSIVSSVREELQIDKPGNGIIFILDVNRAYGLF